METISTYLDILRWVAGLGKVLPLGFVTACLRPLALGGFCVSVSIVRAYE